MANEHVLIIGGTSGFGLEVAKGVVKSGHQVTIVGRHPERVAEVVTALGPSAKGEAFDATDSATLQEFLDGQHYTHVISMLGGAMGGGFLTSSIQTIREAIEAKFFANLQLAQLVMPHIEAGGSLIFTSGSGGSPATASGAIIGNHAINLMVQGLAVEVAPDRRVNAVSPTWTPTGLWRDMSHEEQQQQAQAFAEGVPLHRVAEPVEVASAYLYLMQNQFVTGQVLAVDGGVDLPQ